jgi:hypothetical protein
MPTKNQQPDGLEASCQFCSAPEEVTTFLEHTGIRLDLLMDAFLPPTYSHLAQLPTQFHFKGQAVMEVIYLAGMELEVEEPTRVHTSEPPRCFPLPGHLPGFLLKSYL